MVGLPVRAQDGDATDMTTLDLLESTVVPQRDPVDLAIRLKGVTDVPEPPDSPAVDYEVGDVATFQAENLVEDYTFEVNAELVYETPHIYMFVEVGQPVDRAAVGRSAEVLETLIRPKIHEVFGTEWLPGIDGDPHIYILHTTRVGDWVAGYYDSTSQYPKVVSEKSNEHEMFVINLDNMARTIGTPRYEAVLAHEFQHMVHWAVDLNEDTWLNEGLSELARLLTGYGASPFAPPFLGDPGIQLNHWPEDSSARGLHYGAAFMFAAYFYDRYGEAATTTLVSQLTNGMESVENALAAIDATDPLTGEPVLAADIFADWLVANLLMDPDVGDGRYAYQHPDVATLPNAELTMALTPDDPAVTLQGVQWGPQYLRIAGGAEAQQVDLVFDAADTVRIVPVDAYSGEYMWWSNRTDESDTRLTRAFDLTDVERATLHFRLWYFIENLWDYGYVMASTDDGATWTPLETDATTTENPHGNAFGHAYTGSSGGWIEQTVDLTTYAGQDILLRFEYITDAAVTQPGMLVDDVRIPEIGYESDFESGDGGWQPEGWLRMDNRLPQRFLVQLVQPGSPDGPVTRLLGGDDEPRGVWPVTVGGAQGDAVIVVSGLAPVTTEPAIFTIGAAAQMPSEG
jgi:hypothetical protein